MDQTNNISAFENFNFYDILQPQKVYDVKTDVLVDIDDGKPDPELIGSFADKVKKSQYDLVDLFQNIYVSPQHVKPKSDLDFEFPNFENKQLDVASNNKEKEHIERKEVNNFVSKQYMESVNLDFTAFDLCTASNSNNKNNIQTQVTDLASRSNHENKQLERTTSRSFDEILDNVILKKNLPPKLERLREPEPILDEIDNVLQKNYDNNELKNPPQHFKEVEENIKKVKSPLYKTECINTTEFNPSTNLEKKNVVINVYQNDIKSSIIDLNKPVITSKFQEPIPMLQTMKKDNKVFAKRRIVTPDKEKNNFTKGPDLYEKSLILPQIMERLAIRKKNMDAKKNVTRKLILDRPNKIQIPDLSPIVLQSDCNKERLKDLRTRKAFREFINSGNYF